MRERVCWLHAPAKNPDPVYAFDGARGRVEWPTRLGRNLAGGGVWNLLFRLGLAPGEAQIDENCHIILALDGPLPAAELRQVRERLDHGPHMVFAAGDPEAMQELLPDGVVISSEMSPYPASALAWKGLVSDDPQIVAPPGWNFFRLQAGDQEVEIFGELFALGGERQSPERALRIPLAAPAAIQSGRLVLLNGNPFAALQSWLQGQEELEPWLCWRNSMFWLDEQVEFLADALEHLGLPLSEIPAPGVAGLAGTTIVMRHDLDSSRDTSMLEASCAMGSGATHAVLLDDNTDFWTQALKAAPRQESAFHYDTLRRDTLFEWARRQLGWRPPTEYRPAYETIAGSGLLKQVRAAQESGIGTRTLHRHASFIIYPELVDALDHVFLEDAAVLGGSTYFRGQVLRWGIDRTDGERGTLGAFPYPMVPFWFPFRLAHAGDNGRLTRGFETTSIMEVEPDFVAQLLDYRSRRLKQHVLTLSYHPFHAQKPGFNPDGTLPWFKQILAMLKERDIPIITLEDVMYKVRRSVDGGKSV